MDWSRPSTHSSPLWKRTLIFPVPYCRTFWSCLVVVLTNTVTIFLYLHVWSMCLSTNLMKWIVVSNGANLDTFTDNAQMSGPKSQVNDLAWKAEQSGAAGKSQLSFLYWASFVYFYKLVINYQREPSDHNHHWSVYYFSYLKRKDLSSVLQYISSVYITC